MKKAVTTIVTTLLFTLMIVTPALANPIDIPLTFLEDPPGYGIYYAKSYPDGKTQGNHRVTFYEVRNVEKVKRGGIITVAYKGYGGTDLTAQVIHRFDEDYIKFYGTTCWYRVAHVTLALRVVTEY
ncbi:hypothetical protein [Brevibacillus borstelensis]|uniref:hypothetical protein n=1 Tax=Brevibacillus borstelensis TaxID=45462 RepID=UPI0030BCA448